MALYQGQPRYVLALVGDSEVGKSTILNKFLYGSTTDVGDSAVGCDWPTKTVHIGPDTIQIRDTYGQERYRSLTRAYYRDCSAFIFVYDITRVNTFESMTYWLLSAKDGHAQVVENPAEGTQGVSPLQVLVGNKMDLKEERKVTHEQGQQFAEINDMIFTETSAMEGINIQGLFNQIAATLHNDPNFPETTTVVFSQPPTRTDHNSTWCNC